MNIEELKEKYKPFDDPYFNGLTMKVIAELAKKSIRLTKQHCDDNHKIEDLLEQNQELKNEIDWLEEQIIIMQSHN